MSQQSVGYDIIRVGNVGTMITVNLTKIDRNQSPPVEEPVDCTNRENVFVHLRKPSGKILEFIADVVNPPGSDGKIRYVDNQGVFDRPGRWACRGVLLNTNGNTFKGSWSGFTVDV